VLGFGVWVLGTTPKSPIPNPHFNKKQKRKIFYFIE